MGHRTILNTIINPKVQVVHPVLDQEYGMEEIEVFDISHQSMSIRGMVMAMQKNYFGPINLDSFLPKMDQKLAKISKKKSATKGEFLLSWRHGKNRGMVIPKFKTVCILNPSGSGHGEPLQPKRVCLMTANLMKLHTCRP